LCEPTEEKGAVRKKTLNLVVPGRFPTTGNKCLKHQKGAHRKKGKGRANTKIGSRLNVLKTGTTRKVHRPARFGRTVDAIQVRRWKLGKKKSGGQGETLGKKQARTAVKTKG